MMLKGFTVSWMMYWGAVWLLPVQSVYSAVGKAGLLQMSFVGLVIISAKLFSHLLGSSAEPPEDRRAEKNAHRLVWIALAVSTFGVVCLGYDKIVLQQIDYSRGLAVAREAWRQAGEMREGRASSALSAIGYLTSSAYVVPAVVILRHPRMLSPTENGCALGLCLVLLFANSALTGGRSSILLMAAMGLGAHWSPRPHGVSRSIPGSGMRRIFVIVGLLAVGYIVFIFAARAGATGISVRDYSIRFLSHLGLTMDQSLSDRLGDGPVGMAVSMSVLAASYVTHSFSTTAAILELPPEGKTIMFLHVGELLFKLGLVDRPQGDWTLAGRFPSMPGALWCQFGPRGFLWGSVLLGVISALSEKYISRRPDDLFSLGAFVFVFSILVLSPMLFALDFLSFPFMVFSFGLFAMLGLFLHPRRASPKM
jgi:hypothetical protein